MAAVLLALLAAGCGDRYWMPGHRQVYANATAAIRSAADFPPDASVETIENCRISILKNAARIDVPVRYRDAAGGQVSTSYTVWLNRVARTWTPHRVYRSASPPPAG